MKKLSIVLLSLGLAASCSSSKTETQPDEEIKETTEVAEAPAAATPDAIVVDAYQKYSAGDIEGTLAYFAEGAEWQEVGGPGGTTADMLAGYKGMMSDLQVAPRRVFVAADAGITVTQGVLKGTNDGAMPDGTPAANKPVAHDYLHIQWWNDEGKITKTWSLSNGTTIPKMAGLMPVPEGTAPPVTSEWPTAGPEVVMASDNQANIDAVKAQAQAAVSGDFETYKANMPDDYSGAAFGEHSLNITKDSSIAWLEGMHKSFTEGQLENVHIWSFVYYVVTVDKVTMKHTGDMGPMKATNKTVSIHFAGIYKCTYVKISWAETYSNPMELMMQIMPPKADATAMAQ